MEVDLTNKDNLKLYVEDNIVLINSKISMFKKSKISLAIFDETDIKNYLSDKFNSELKANYELLLMEIKNAKFVKKRIIDIANKYVFYKSNLEQFYEQETFNELRELFDNDSTGINDKIVDLVFNELNFDENKSKFIRSSYLKVISKSNYIASTKGFYSNLNNIESGIMSANAGDSAQFLFLSRAILAGYNTSNVDVRSSKYDAIIDYRGYLFKVQVKGISSGVVSFKERDRGGRGIDHTNQRNIGKIITSKDCDIYVAVDKQVGICYIIPMKIIDNKYTDEEKVNIKISELFEFKENWDMISFIYELLYKNDDSEMIAF